MAVEYLPLLDLVRPDDIIFTRIDHRPTSIKACDVFPWPTLCFFLEKHIVPPLSPASA